jgi:hypothetical protein
MHKKEYTLGEGGGALWGGALGPGAADETLGFFYFPLGGRGAASQDRTTRLPQLGLWDCSYCRGGVHDPVSPPGHRYLDVIHLHQPWRQMLERRNPRWDEEEEDDAVEEETNEWIRVFTLTKRALFTSTHWWASAEARSKVYLWAFTFCPEQTIKEASTYQEKRYIQKKRKVSIKHNVPRLGLRGLHHKKRREESLSANNTEKYRKRQYMEQTCLYFLSLYPKKFGYSLRGYSHRERWSHTR